VLSREPNRDPPISAGVDRVDRHENTIGCLPPGPRLNYAARTPEFPRAGNRIAGLRRRQATGDIHATSLHLTNADRGRMAARTLHGNSQIVVSARQRRHLDVYLIQPREPRSQPRE
jgi:hypothetical protein